MLINKNDFNVMSTLKLNQTDIKLLFYKYITLINSTMRKFYNLLAVVGLVSLQSCTVSEVAQLMIMIPYLKHLKLRMLT
jgi:hypothetical protein